MSEYDKRFYDTIRPGCQQSATAVAPAFLRLLRPWEPSSVLDVGCGEGWWAHAFVTMGVERAVGLDVGDVASPAPDVERHTCDLTKPWPVTEGFDLAVSLEVAEHLPESAADGFVASLCAAAPVVLFSAAIPRQGGTGHVNCQPPSYWAEKFAAHGYECNDRLRQIVWEWTSVEPWYRNNILTFFDPDHIDLGPGVRPMHLQHPDLWLG